MMRRTCLYIAPLIVLPALFAGCETDDSLPSRPRTGFLAPDAQSQDNAEKRALEKPEGQVPASDAPDAGHSDASTPGDRTVVTLQSVAAQQAAADSKNPFNAILRELGFQGPNDWAAFGHTKGPMDTYDHDPYPQLMPHLPENPGATAMVGSVPAPSGDWSVENSWGQGIVLENYPHRAWNPSVAEYEQGDVKHNPIYFFNVQDHVHVKQYIQDFNRDVADKNFQSEWFYLNAVGMPVWLALEPPNVPYISPKVQGVERHIPQETLDDWKTVAYLVPWFYVESAALPAFMAIEPPLSQRITAYTGDDPSFLGHLPPEGQIVPTPVPGKLQWNYPFLNPDGTVKPPTPTAEQPAPPSRL